MAEISASTVKDLRERTGAGMMDCKKALIECSGNLDQAMEWLRKKGLSSADKKSGRAAAEGIVVAYVAPDSKTAALFEVNCETDFVARTDDFKSFAKEIATQVVEKNPKDLTTLLSQPYRKDGGKTVEQTTKEIIAKIGENIVCRRFERFETSGFVASYIHGDGKIGVLVEVSGPKADATINFAKDVAMHVAAINPRFARPDEVPASVRDNEKRILTEQAATSGKPANVIEKMVEGRLQKFLAEICLVKQPFVKDPDKTVEQVQKETSAAAGGPVEVKRFVRLQMGEGLEKKADDFASEVAKMAGKG